MSSQKSPRRAAVSHLKQRDVDLSDANNIADAECVQRQQFAIFKGDVLVLVVVQNMLNIPFKECFTVNTCWLIQPFEGGCRLKSFVKVNFVKGCLLAGIIRLK